MIATFPHFTDLNENLRDEFVAFTSRFEPYSDFNFTSLYCWNIDGSTKVSWLNGNLVIQLPDYLTGENVYSILGIKDADDSVKTLCKGTKTLKLIPEVTVGAIKDKESLNIEEDPDNFDYIFSVEDQAQFSGVKFKSKRNKVNRYKTDYGDRTEIKTIGFSNIATSEINKVLDSWSHERRRASDDTEAEFTAISNLVNNPNLFNLLCVLIYIDNEPVGFSINEILGNGYAVCHFQKSVLSFENIDVYLSSEVAKILEEQGCTYLNWEQDLGLPGIRTLKQNYQPVKFLKKYKISLKD